MKTIKSKVAHKHSGDSRKTEAESASNRLNEPAAMEDWRSTLRGFYYSEMLSRPGRWKSAHLRHTAHDIASIALQLSAQTRSKRPILELLEDAADLLDVTAYFLATKMLKAQLGTFDRHEKLYLIEEILVDDTLTWKSERGLFKAIERTFGRDRLKEIKARRAVSETELREILKDLKQRNQDRTSPAREAQK